jgi:glutathione synthase/RimK-type ligase-like ATP-grasp enzyme
LIAVFSYPDEDHTTKVIDHLRQAGASHVLIDMGEFPAQRTVSLEWTSAGKGRFLVDDERGRIDFKDVQAVWWRRLRNFTIDEAVKRGQERYFADSETSQAVLGFLDSLGCPWVNPRAADEAAHRKPLQWTRAQACGLQIPWTLATTNAQDARDFIASLGDRKAVFKPFLATIEDWRETRIVTPSDVDRLESVKYAPVIFQEYIEGVDLRVTVIGGQIFAAEIDARDTSYPFDMRMVVGETSVKPTKLPEDVAAALLELMRNLGIVYGAADFRRTDDGVHYFLEVNPAGQWLFVEDRTDMPITAAIAAYLIACANEYGMIHR